MLNEYALYCLAREHVGTMHEAAAHAAQVAEARPSLRARVAAWMIRTGRRLLSDDRRERRLETRRRAAVNQHSASVLE